MIDNLNGKIIAEAITFDDVLLIPAHSQVLPHEVSLQTRLTPTITLNIPFVSAAMDTVTEAPLAIALARLGGLGFVHKNLSIAAQAKQVAQVKQAQASEVDYPQACVDAQGRLRVGAAVGASQDVLERVQALVDAGVDVVTVDSAHGHSQGVIDAVKCIREAFTELPLIGGNIVTAEAAHDLVEAGANTVKVGVGPGSICTTRVVAGVGMPQLSAINAVLQYCEHHNIPLIADGGIKYSGDVVKALAAGADVVMIGSLLAGTEESPGEVFELHGQRFKTYVGMGSLAAMERGSKDRYFQQTATKLVPEGIEGRVAYKGPVADVVHQLCGGLRSGMGYCGTPTVDALKQDGRFVKITAAGLKESHPHDVTLTKSAPNYSQGT